MPEWYNFRKNEMNRFREVIDLGPENTPEIRNFFEKCAATFL